MRTKMVAGNWKMHGTAEGARALVAAVVSGAPEGVDVVVAPPFVFLADLVRAFGASRVAFSSQDASAHAEGAYTGEVSARMLAELGLRHAIVGHSERRQYHGESDATVAAKVVAVQAAGLVPIACVGETLAEREAGRTEAVLDRQLGALIDGAGIAAFERLVLAYEPVWAIGENGIPATADYADARQAEIIATAQSVLGHRVPCLYGGSVNPENCAELISCPHVDGLFIGRSAWAVEGYLDILSRCAATL